MPCAAAVRADDMRLLEAVKRLRRLFILLCSLREPVAAAQGDLAIDMQLREDAAREAAAVGAADDQHIPPVKQLVGDVKDRICVITDDMTSTAGTLCAAAKILKDQGAAKVYAAVSHCLLSKTGRNG